MKTIARLPYMALAAGLLILASLLSVTRLPARADEPAPTPTPAPYVVYLPLVVSPDPWPPLEWDPRLTTLNIGLTRAEGSPRWRLVKALFQNHIEGGGGHSIAVDLLDPAGNRMTLPYGTEVGFVANGGQVALEWTKWDEPYPVVYGIYGGLGSYSVWITLAGTGSDVVSGMGLVASDGTDAPLAPEPGKVHVNYLLTFRLQ